MAKNESWIKLYRNLLDWEWYNDTNTKILFIHILLKCNFKNKNWKGVEIQRGQLITSTQNLATELGLSVQEVKTVLKKLKLTNVITSKGTSRYTTITLVNYDKYQSINNVKQPTSNQQTTGKQQQLKKVKKVKKERNITTSTAKLESNLILIESIAKELNVSNEIVINQIHRFIKYCIHIKKEYHNDETDLFKHFKSWIDKQDINKINIDSEQFKINVDYFIKLFNAISRRNFRATPKIKELFAIQLDNGFTGEQMEIAIKNLYSTDDKNKYHKENSYQTATPLHFLKDDNVNKYLNTHYGNNSTQPIYRRNLS